jgi:hypothetical protein
MRLPSGVDQITVDVTTSRAGPYPPLGFWPIAEQQLGNGDAFGLYWPIGRETEEPIVCEMWHDEWALVPMFSTLGVFLDATASLGEDEHPTIPDRAIDPKSPIACFNVARAATAAGRLDEVRSLLEHTIETIPEYTDALALLALVLQRLGHEAEAIRVALRAISSPPSFGARPTKLLHWLRSRRDPPEDLVSDPIWQVRAELRLSYGGTKENNDYPLMLRAIETHLSRREFLRAVTLMQTYAELMTRETVSFQERYGFNSRTFLERQRHLFEFQLGATRTPKL